MQLSENAAIRPQNLLCAEWAASAHPLLSKRPSLLARFWKFNWEVRIRKRLGLTLIELVVVMVILMALAAIVLPMFPSMIERAHRASQGTNTREITKAILMYQSMYGNYPDGYDLMTDGTSNDQLHALGTGASPMPLGELAHRVSPTTWASRTP